MILEPAGHSPVTILFKPLEDETTRYERAENALTNCRWQILRSGSYSTTWVFDGLREMTEYIFEYYGQEPDPVRVGIMKGALGSRAHERPLEIEDITRWWLLAEDARD